MDLLAAAYGSGDDSDDNSAAAPPLEAKVLARRVQAAPVVWGATSAAMQPKYASTAMVEMKTNLPSAALLAPMAGPDHPHKPGMLGVAANSTSRHANGGVEKTTLEDWAFHEQFHTYQSYGYAQSTDAGNGGVVGNAAAAAANHGDTVSTKRKKRRKLLPGENPNLEQKQVPDDLGDAATNGVWAPVQEVDALAPKLDEDDAEEIAEELMSDKKRSRGKEYSQEEDHDRRDERKVAHTLPPRHNRDTEAATASSKFHGKGERDYQGNPWCDPPKGLRPDEEGEHDCFIPKRCVHRWGGGDYGKNGHTKGVQTVRFSPGTGHLLLTASMDHSCKIWEVYGERRLRRTYSGHDAACRDANFSPDGKQFTSAGFDRFVRVWDVETGASIHCLTPKRKMAYCVKYNPTREDTLLAGCSDNRIYQFDLRSGNIVQEYNHHLQSVNTVTFIDEGRRFVSTSDDKKVLVWEMNIPVPMKYISEPHMCSIPAVTLHPDGSAWAGQSMDNQIVVYGARDRMKQLRKKLFKGHTNSGYACEMAFSPNGRYLSSGDGEGKLFFWDWKTTKIVRRFHAHDGGPCIGNAWHPLEPSWCVTSGWDGAVKLWD